MKKIFLVYGHYNENSFNAAIKNEFIKHSELKGNKVDVVDLYKSTTSTLLPFNSECFINSFLIAALNEFSL